MNLIDHTSHQVDVVIPAFNAAKYIKETLFSVAAQGNVLSKIIVVNDGSTDDTQTIILDFAERNPQLSIQIIHQDNAGLSAARNAGIKASTAPYIAFLDADDLWITEKLIKQLSVFRQSKNDGLGLVYCAYGVISEKSERLPSVIVISPSLRGDASKKLLLGNFISGSGSAVLIKRTVFETVGVFDEKLRAGEDWDMWIRISKHFLVDYCPEELVLIRLHQSNMQKDVLRMLSSDLMILNKFVLAGQTNNFLLWKIRTYLIQRKMQGSEIPGFDQCAPELRNKLSGLRMKTAAFLLAPFALAAKSYFHLKP